eukprot:TRINITY_DN12882_c0_g1_i1.p1 TRINITY_DN12882_c0_g1~~TRINITY_DN12882_c0_g1_i1.p1  ORF type:complete len:375 (+),score=56.78 TRINITY_DN12882_c0_g1_i1:1-1125(+)
MSDTRDGVLAGGEKMNPLGSPFGYHVPVDPMVASYGRSPLADRGSLQLPSVSQLVSGFAWVPPPIAPIPLPDVEMDLEADETLEPSPPPSQQTDDGRGSKNHGRSKASGPPPSPPRRSSRAAKPARMLLATPPERPLSRQSKQRSKRTNDDSDEEEQQPKRSRHNGHGSDYQDDGDSDVVESGGARRALRSQRPARNARDRNDKRRRRGSDDESDASASDDASTTAAPVTTSQVLTRRGGALANKKQPRFLPGIVVVSNLANEPCLKYSLQVVGDRGLDKSMFLSQRLAKEAMYIEAKQQRFELTRNGTGGYRWTRHSKPLQSVQSSPLTQDAEVVADNLKWVEIQWGPSAIIVRGTQYQPSCVFWRPIKSAQV